MRNVLVTGGAGFIGSNFVRHLLKRETQVRIVNLDALTYAGRLENLEGFPEPERHIFVQGDICDRSLLEDLLRYYLIDTVVNFAAESHVDRSLLGPAAFIQTNVVGTFRLLEEVRHIWLHKGKVAVQDALFHHVSTDEVFGSLGPTDSPFSETTPYAPNSPYAASKASSDHLVRAYAHTYGLPVSITNCSNNYGPYQFPEKLIPLMILNALDGRPLPVYGDGEQVRDWLYVEDHCEAIWMVLRSGRPGETYNVGGNTQLTNLQIVHRLCGILDELQSSSPYVPHASLIRFVADRPGHDRRYAMDITKIKDELGWQPRQLLESGLRETVKWYLSNQHWVASVRQQQDYQQWLECNYAARRRINT